MKQEFSVALYSGVSKSTTFIERLISGLADQNIDVYIFGNNNGKPQKSKHVLYKTYNGKFHKLYTLLKYSLGLLFFKPNEKRRLDTFIDSQVESKLNLRLKYYPILYHKPSVFHVQWAKGLADWMWVQDFGIKLVLSLRGAHINYSPIANSELAAMYYKNFPKVDAFHAVSNNIGQEAEKYLAPKEKVQVIYSGINQLAFKSYKKKGYSKHGEVNILSVGRQHWIKGYTYALQAVKALLDRNIKVTYTIIGATNSEELMYLIQDLNISDEVTLTPQMNYEDVLCHMQKADVLLLPSVSEGLANVAIEAMVLGLPVISTNAGGMPELVIHNKTGLLYENRNVEDMVDKLLDFDAMNEKEIALIANNASQKVSEQHHWENFKKDFYTFYESQTINNKQ